MINDTISYILLLMPCVLFLPKICLNLSLSFMQLLTVVNLATPPMAMLMSPAHCSLHKQLMAVMKATILLGRALVLVKLMGSGYQQMNQHVKVRKDLCSVHVMLG